MKFVLWEFSLHTEHSRILWGAPAISNSSLYVNTHIFLIRALHGEWTQTPQNLDEWLAPGPRVLIGLPNDSDSQPGLELTRSLVCDLQTSNIKNVGECVLKAESWGLGDGATDWSRGFIGRRPQLDSLYFKVPSNTAESKPNALSQSSLHTIPGLQPKHKNK